MKVQLVRVGIISALAVVLMASRCSGGGETGKLETTGDLPEEADSGLSNDAPGTDESPDPLGDPFSSGPDSDEPSMESDPLDDEGPTFDDPTFEPESIPDDTEL